MQDTRSDDELLAEAAAGNQDAFEVLVLRWRQTAVRFAAGLVGPNAAEDMAQEAFAKIYFRAGGYTMGTSFKSWLFRIVRNTCIDYQRRLRDTLPLQEALHLSLPNTPQLALARAEEWESLRMGWERLGEDARCALYLYAYEEMPYADIGRALGKSTSQVRMTIYRARKQLRKEMAEP